MPKRAAYSSPPTSLDLALRLFAFDVSSSAANASLTFQGLALENLALGPKDGRFAANIISWYIWAVRRWGRPAAAAGRNNAINKKTRGEGRA